MLEAREIRRSVVVEGLDSEEEYFVLDTGGD